MSPQLVQFLGELALVISVITTVIRFHSKGSKRMSEIEQRLEIGDVRFVEIERRFDAVDTEIKGMGIATNTRLDRIDDKLDRVITHLMEKE